VTNLCLQFTLHLAIQEVRIAIQEVRMFQTRLVIALLAALVFLPGSLGSEAQPEMTAALQNLREAQRNLQLGSHDKGGHRANAIRIIDQAIAEVEAGIKYDNRH
jgi:hypothetical protein